MRFPDKLDFSGGESWLPKRSEHFSWVTHNRYSRCWHGVWGALCQYCKPKQALNWLGGFRKKKKVPRASKEPEEGAETKPNVSPNFSPEGRYWESKEGCRIRRLDSRWFRVSHSVYPLRVSHFVYLTFCSHFVYPTLCISLCVPTLCIPSCVSHPYTPLRRCLTISAPHFVCVPLSVFHSVCPIPSMPHSLCIFFRVRVGPMCLVPLSIYAFHSVCVQYPSPCASLSFYVTFLMSEISSMPIRYVSHSVCPTPCVLLLLFPILYVSLPMSHTLCSTFSMSHTIYSTSCMSYIVFPLPVSHPLYPTRCISLPISHCQYPTACVSYPVSILLLAYPTRWIPLMNLTPCIPLRVSHLTPCIPFLVCHSMNPTPWIPLNESHSMYPTPCISLRVFQPVCLPPCIPFRVSRSHSAYILRH